jgi:hypothetical protein
MSLSWIPLGFLEKIRRICFKFLWAGTQDSVVVPWVSWEKLFVPKSLGGWGLKNIFLFSKSLAAKASWRLIKSKSLWTSVVSQKYIIPDTIEEWIQNLVKRSGPCTVIWKVVLNSFSCNQ